MRKSQKGLFLIGMIGAVGSGKTHIARMLSRRLRARCITTDEIRVKLRRQGKSYDRAAVITRALAERIIGRGESVIFDFDAINPERHRELSELADVFGARLYLITVHAPEGLILARLRRKRYTPSDLFINAEEAVRVYFERKAFRQKFRAERLRLAGVVSQNVSRVSRLIIQSPSPHKSRGS